MFLLAAISTANHIVPFAILVVGQSIRVAAAAAVTGVVQLKGHPECEKKQKENKDSEKKDKEVAKVLTQRCVDTNILKPLPGN